MSEFPDLTLWTPEDRVALDEAVDASDYSFADWAEALAAFDDWLSDREESRRPCREMVGYIHCCADMAAPGVVLGDLKVIVYQALTEYGFAFTDDTQF